MREGAGLGVCSPFLTTSQEPHAAPAVECCGEGITWATGCPFLGRAHLDLSCNLHQTFLMQK